MKPIWERFNLSKRDFEREILKPLREQNIDLDKIDFNSIDSKNDIEGIKQFLKEEYGIQLTQALTKNKIKCDEEKYLEQQQKEIRKKVEQQQYQIDNLFQKAIKRVGNKDEILKEIINYSPHTENITISTLLAVTHKKSVINVSEAGVGKSRGTIELLNLLKIPYNTISGHQTPKKFFMTLKNFNDSLIIIDESAEVLSNMEIRNFLLQALQNNYLSWETERENEEFKFKGTIIFNTNYLPNTPVMRAVCDRCFTNKIELSTEQIIDKIKSRRYYKPNKEIWDKIKNNMFLKEKLTEKEKDAIYKIIELSNPKSVRELNKLRILGLFSIKILGTLELLKFFVKLNNIDFIINNPDIKRSEKVKLIAKEKNVSIRTAQRIIKKTTKTTTEK